MIRSWYVLLLLLLTGTSVFPQAADTSQNMRAADTGRQFHAFSGTLMLGLDGGAVFGFTDYKEVRPDIMGRGYLEYFFPTSSTGSFGIRAFASTGYIGGKDEDFIPDRIRTTFASIGGGVSYNFSIQQSVFPYVFAGGSHTWFVPRDRDGNHIPYNAPRNFKVKEFNFHGEVGVRFLLANQISLSLNIGAQLSPNDNWDAQDGGGNDFFMHGLVGLTYSFFTKVDSDGDGIPDNIDQCSQTPAGVKVDDFGCPLDADGDGVPDYLDKCARTPRGVEVDEEGCVLDEDGDGVTDKLDKCPGTPGGAKVNEAGCPDTDKDGVYDDADKCADTPANAPVDENGCPRDSDNDGVPDFRDDCPNTPAGTEVNERGCTRVVKQVLLEGDTNFEFNKAELLPSAYTLLNQLARVMKENPDTRWTIEGHTDAVGSDSYNTELSRKRAQSVADYLASQGIERNRFEVVPLGESKPVATNDTKEGRAMNRRVEIKLIEEEEKTK